MNKENILPVIKNRISVRRYAKKEITPDLLEEIQSWNEKVFVLEQNNTYELKIVKSESGQDLGKVMGAYGRITNPPVYLIPFLSGKKYLLTDCGYRTQQLVIRLSAKGLGTCYLGAITRQDTAREVFDLPAGATLAAFLIFGYPAEHFGGQLVNNFMHHITGANRKLPAEEIFYQEDFRQPQKPPQELSEIIEAARLSPSAVNAQPWRFLWKEGNLYLYLKNFNSKYAQGEAQNYRYYDGGICMGNISMALTSKDIPFSWVMAGETDPDFPACPQELEPLARLTMGSD